MPASWITERPSHRRPARPMEPARPQLQLPVHGPEFARPRPEAKAEEEAERGAAVVDFYI